MKSDPQKTPDPPRKRPVSCSRVVRAKNGRAFRLSVQDDTLGQFLVAQQDRERLERDAARLARAQRLAEFEPCETALKQFLNGLAPLIERNKANSGFYYSRGKWRCRRLSAQQHLLLEIRAMKASADVDHLTDLARSARDAWIALAAGDDPEISNGLKAEYAEHRATWTEPTDPPVLGLLAKAIALLWMQSTYHDLRYAHAMRHQATIEEVRFHAERAQSAREQAARLQKELQDIRMRLTLRDKERVAIELLNRDGQRRKRKRTNSSEKPR